MKVYKVVPSWTDSFLFTTRELANESIRQTFGVLRSYRHQIDPNCEFWHNEDHSISISVDEIEVHESARLLEN